MIREFLQEVKDAIDRINPDDIQHMVDTIGGIRGSGRLFFIGSGGGAGHASHAVCDFRKLCGIESYSVSDNIPELTARTNDEGWEKTGTGYLADSNFNEKDCLFVFSVGGGNQGVSMNITNAIRYAKNIGAKVVGIVGKEGTLTEFADAYIVITGTPLTPVCEGLQSVIAHLIVTELQIKSPVW
jgi:D-sedoheptulose 7-phosphate isomerase